MAIEKNVFHDISVERSRTYEFPGGDRVVVANPVKLSVSERHGHRIVDARNVAHYIPPGWIHLYWSVKDGAELFVQ